MSLVADVAEPLILADGTKINPVNGKVIREREHKSSLVEIPSASAAQEIVARTRRSLAELPLPSGQMHGVSLVLFYSLWGLSNQDIAIAVNISIDQVKIIKKTKEYQQASEDIRNTILEHESNDIRTFMQQNARTAAETIVDLVEEGGVLGFKAAQDVLDRAGHRPADIVEHKHSLEGSLRIEYVEKGPRENLPAIDADFEVVE